MAGRPKRTTGGTRSPLLMALLGGAGGGDLSGISFQDDPNDEFAQDFGDNPNQVAVEDHWWNRGKAQDVNNRIQLQGINANNLATITNNAALDQARQMLPIKLEELRKSGDITNEQKVKLEEALTAPVVDRLNKIGEATTNLKVSEANKLRPSKQADLNDALMSRLGLPANDDNLTKYQNTIPETLIADKLQELMTNTRRNQATSDDINRDQKSKESVFDALNLEQQNRAQLGVQQTGYDLSNFLNANSQKKLVDAAKLRQLNAEATRALNVPVGGKASVLNLETGVMRTPPDPLANLLSPNGVSGALPKSPAINTPQTVVPTPKNQADGEITVQNGKVGTLVNGVFIPFGGQ